jgi:hypothetical protein
VAWAGQGTVLGPLALAFAVAVGFSRVYLGAHSRHGHDTGGAYPFISFWTPGSTSASAAR